MYQSILDFDQASGMQVLDMPDAKVSYYPEFLQKKEANGNLQSFIEELAWRQDHIKMFGKSVKIPRLQAWYGDEQAVYQYSGLDMQPLPWHPNLFKLKDKIEQITGKRFNSVLANLYRDGNDGMGMHADNEPELGRQPCIASLTLGQERELIFKHIQSKKKHTLSLAHGSLLVMAGATQEYWQHGLNKSKKSMLPRVNLTFRWIHSR